MSKAQRMGFGGLIEERMRPFVVPDARFDLDLTWFIPGFLGAEQAVERLVSSEAYASASRLFVTPDNALASLRERALKDGKSIVMPTYGLRRGFVVLDGKSIDPLHAKFASWLDGLDTFSRSVSLDQLASSPKVELIVTAASAISLSGQRFGMGSQYLDLEYPILATLGAVDQTTPIAAIVHDEQVWAHPLSEMETDVRADIIFTPTRVRRIPPSVARPKIIRWDLVAPNLADERYFARLSDMQA